MLLTVEGWGALEVSEFGFPDNSSSTTKAKGWPCCKEPLNPELIPLDSFKSISVQHNREARGGRTAEGVGKKQKPRGCRWFLNRTIAV